MVYDAELQLIFRRLKNAAYIDDAYFDRIFPDWAKKASLVHWTPACAAIRAVQFLNHQKPGLKILDIGSGVGKFCLIGSAISEARFVGVELRPHLVELSQRLIHLYKIPRVSFKCGDSLELDWSRYDAVYLYNPFEENRSQSQRIDSTVALDYAAFSKLVSLAYGQLEKLSKDTLVMTYHGFGGAMSPGYRNIFREYWVHGPLECWIKDR